LASTFHTPALLKETLEALQIKKDGIYVDATFGGGGHATEILKNLNNGKLIVFDQDPTALKNKPDAEKDKLIKIHSNFRFMQRFLTYINIIKVDGIVADLGVSSYQFDTPERGFSTRFNYQLDLRMNPQSPFDAREIINSWSKEKLSDIFFGYADLTNANAIATKLIEERKHRKIETTFQLMEVLQPLTHVNFENKFFARVFQALRIAVNDELNSLKEFLNQTATILNTGGRLAVLTYHSLEDRIVKNFMRSGNAEGKINKDDFGNPQVSFKSVYKKPIQPSAQEIKNNQRARSAKLRVGEKLEKTFKV